MALSGYPLKSCSRLGNRTNPVKARVPITKAIKVPIVKFLSKNIPRFMNGVDE